MIDSILFDQSDLDEADVKLLEALQNNGRSTFAELGSLVGLKAPAVHDRVKRLENRGYVRGYSALLDSRRLGLELTAFVSCFTTPEAEYESFSRDIAALPEVCEIHSVAGDESFVIKVVTRSTGHLDELLGRIKRVRGIARTKTTIVLSTPFERGGVSIR